MQTLPVGCSSPRSTALVYGDQRSSGGANHTRRNRIAMGYDHQLPNQDGAERYKQMESTGTSTSSIKSATNNNNIYQSFDKHQITNDSIMTTSYNSKLSQQQQQQHHQQQIFPSEMSVGPNLVSPDDKNSLKRSFFDDNTDSDSSGSSNSSNSINRNEEDRYHPSAVERNSDTQDREDAATSASSTSCSTTTSSSPIDIERTNEDLFPYCATSAAAAAASSISSSSPIECDAHPTRINEEQDGTPWHTHGAFDNTDSIGPAWYDPFARHGRKFIRKPRVKFQSNIVTNIHKVPRVDRKKKHELFYTTEDFMQFREEVIYRQEATWENLVVDYCEDKWNKLEIFCGCKEAVKKDDETMTEETTKGETTPIEEMDIEKLSP